MASSFSSRPHHLIALYNSCDFGCRDQQYEHQLGLQRRLYAISQSRTFTQSLPFRGVFLADRHF